MVYECSFDFTIVKPKTSHFIGKSGVVELDSDSVISDEEIELMKKDKGLKSDIAHHLNTTLKQKNIFMVTIKNITPKK